MLSTDSQIFHNGSAVRHRILEYGKLVEELHVIVFTLAGQKAKREKIGSNVFVYPTNSKSKFLYPCDSKRIALSLGLGGGWLITAQDPFETGAVGHAIKKIKKIPLQVQVHTDFLNPFFWRQSLKNAVRRFWWGVRILKKADCIRVVSEKIKKSLTNRGIPEGRIAVAPIFVEFKRLRDAVSSDLLAKKYGDDFIILTVARLVPEKNLQLAINAVAEVMRGRKNLRYIIIGGGDLQKKLAKEVEKLKLEHRIEVKQVNSKDLPAWYKRAGLFLLTSNYEGYGMVAVEAAAAGIPVVMTKVGVEIGKVVPVGDKKRLAEVLKEFVTDPKKREDLVRKQNEFFQNWPTNEQYLNKIKELWQNCCLSPKK